MFIVDSFGSTDFNILFLQTRSPGPAPSSINCGHIQELVWLSRNIRNLLNRMLIPLFTESPRTSYDNCDWWKKYSNYLINEFLQITQIELWKSFPGHPICWKKYLFEMKGQLDCLFSLVMGNAPKPILLQCNDSTNIKRKKRWGHQWVGGTRAQWWMKSENLSHPMYW